VTSVAAWLAAANVLGAATGFITGPLIARAVGASGRGDLAAITVPLVLAPAILGLGLTGYSYRSLPRGRAVGEVIASLGLPLLLLGLLAAACAVPVSDALAGGRPDVRTWLLIVFLMMPLLLIGSLFATSLIVLERWRAVVVTSITPFVVACVGIVGLDITGNLTVSTAAAATLAGSLLALIPGIPLLAESRLRFRASIARAGLNFGLKGWIGGLALLANARLDQLVMITSVAPRELGLYVVANTISGASGLASGGLAPPLMARVAAGETAMMAQAVRIMLLATVCLNVVLAAVTPVMLSVLFGPQFSDAFPMVLILLVAQVPLVGATVLSGALQADGAPLIPTVGEGIALLITVPGLILLLGPLGGIGAAIISCAAYAASFTFQVGMARRRLRLPVREFLVPTRADVRWIWGRLAAAGHRLARHRNTIEETC
jgi:O-antigen/teichoic acid export membrane protein